MRGVDGLDMTWYGPVGRYYIRMAALVDVDQGKVDQRGRQPAGFDAVVDAPELHLVDERQDGARFRTLLAPHRIGPPVAHRAHDPLVDPFGEHDAQQLTLARGVPGSVEVNAQAAPAAAARPNGW